MTDHGGYVAGDSKRLQTEQLLQVGRVMETLATLASMSGKQRATALESHLVEDIEDTEPREQLDEAIWHLGLIELGVQFGVASPPDRSIHDALSVPEIRRYAFQFYPQVLPEMLFERLGGDPSIPDGHYEESGQFATVLQLGARLGRPRIDRFLSSLDGFSGGDDDIPELARVLKRLRDPDRVLGYLIERGRLTSPLDLTCAGVVDFLDWLEEFDQLLCKQSSVLAASAIWHQFGYWMNLMGGTVYGATAAALDGVATAIEGLANKSPDSPTTDAVNRLNRYTQSLQKLTSPLFAAPLIAMREQHRERANLHRGFKSPPDSVDADEPRPQDQPVLDLPVFLGRAAI